jgi:hypothetical protein
VQKALIFKLANLEGAVLTGIIPHFAIAETVSLTKELDPTTRIEEPKTSKCVCVIRAGDIQDRLSPALLPVRIPSL